ncbi:PseG/SpsG family protein [Leptospira noguchii]|uniref:PseG/SpsG family protein n=1 Tax=Leptospira noguchii TaxID=28182 RepID=UPI000A51A465|nr:UDP-2,4-diacetamido-2,4,6-trideoxy-beta-L-altropyranose hydrolase [Leptospira noguchii]UOG59335.1 UDP-2,4-diacetamido-2,4,6-trideoxy-beta-L-altropyranose hydrolase [Leptospira noguchii]
MNNKVFIFTECLTFTGLGHLSRCTALAEILQEAGRHVQIILHTDGTDLGDQTNVSIRFLDWKDLKILSDFLNSENLETVFVDSYLADVDVYELIIKKTKKLICIDDVNRILYPERAFILNPGFGGEHLDYDKERNKIFTGIEYVLLRKPFRDLFEAPRFREKIKSILVILGGGDDKWGLIPKILEILTKEYPAWKKEIVIGPALRNLKEIESKKDRNTNLHSGLNAIDMRDLMLSVDLAITAGGQTTYELAKCEVPMVIIETAENQRLNTFSFLTKDLSLNVKFEELKVLENILNKTLYQMNASLSRARYKKNYHDLFDGMNSCVLYDSMLVD